MSLLHKIVERMKTINGHVDHVATMIDYRKKEDKIYLFMPIKDATPTHTRRCRETQVTAPYHTGRQNIAEYHSIFPDDVMACFQEGKLDCFSKAYGL